MTHLLTTIEQVANANPGNDALIEAAIEATYQRIRKPFYAHAGYIDRSKLERQRRNARTHDRARTPT